MNYGKILFISFKVARAEMRKHDRLKLAFGDATLKQKVKIQKRILKATRKEYEKDGVFY